jgi:hypothetical protein
MLVERDRVLDFGRHPREAWGTNPNTQETRKMLDSGALGTLVIGLETVRREQELTETPVPRRPRSARSLEIRVALAGALRNLADLVEPRRRTPSPNRV